MMRMMIKRKEPKERYLSLERMNRLRKRMMRRAEEMLS